MSTFIGNYNYRLSQRFYLTTENTEEAQRTQRRVYGSASLQVYGSAGEASP